jgi:hypothetical protein
VKKKRRSGEMGRKFVWKEVGTGGGGRGRKKKKKRQRRRNHEERKLFGEGRKQSGTTRKIE